MEYTCVCGSVYKEEWMLRVHIMLFTPSHVLLRSDPEEFYRIKFQHGATLERKEKRNGKRNTTYL